VPVKRRTTRRRTADTDRLEIEWLLGRSKRRFFANENPFGDPPDLEHERESWARLGGDVVALFIEDAPGERPPAWWKHEAISQRRSDETTSDYLTRLQLWHPGEKARYEARKVT
jgi:hypothetical protein